MFAHLVQLRRRQPTSSSLVRSWTGGSLMSSPARQERPALLPANDKRNKLRKVSGKGTLVRVPRAAKVLSPQFPPRFHADKQAGKDPIDAKNTYLLTRWVRLGSLHQNKLPRSVRDSCSSHHLSALVCPLVEVG